MKKKADARKERDAKLASYGIDLVELEKRMALIRLFLSKDDAKEKNK